jgi:hypothetical protein
METRSDSNPAKNPWVAVRFGSHPRHDKARRDFGGFWNRAEPNGGPKPGSLAGYPDPLLTLVTCNQLLQTLESSGLH